MNPDREKQNEQVQWFDLIKILKKNLLRSCKHLRIADKMIFTPRYYLFEHFKHFCNSLDRDKEGCLHRSLWYLEQIGIDRVFSILDIDR